MNLDMDKFYSIVSVSLVVQCRDNMLLDRAARLETVAELASLPACKEDDLAVIVEAIKVLLANEKIRKAVKRLLDSRLKHLQA